MIAVPSSEHSSSLPTVPSGPPAHCCKRRGKVVWREGQGGVEGGARWCGGRGKVVWREGQQAQVTYTYMHRAEKWAEIRSRSENEVVFVVTT